MSVLDDIRAALDAQGVTHLIRVRGNKIRILVLLGSASVHTTCDATIAAARQELHDRLTESFEAAETIRANAAEAKTAAIALYQACEAALAP